MRVQHKAERCLQFGEDKLKNLIHSRHRQLRASVVSVPSTDNRIAHNMATTFSWRNLPHRVALSLYFLLLTTQIGGFKPNFSVNALFKSVFNPLNAELNPMCHLLALLGAHHILHISRIRVKSTNPQLHLSNIYQGFSLSYRAYWYNQSFIYSPTDALVICLKKQY